jgi:hypothetical protein
MNKIFSLCFVFLAVISFMPGVSFAQPIDTTGIMNPEVPATIETEYMKNKLALDSSTASAVYDINLRSEKRNQQIITSNKSNATKFRELQLSSQTRDAEMKRVLTKDQYNKYMAMKKDMMSTVKEKLNKK